MSYKTYFYHPLNNIRRHKTRSFLASLGIIIGCASIVSLMYSGEIAKKSLMDTLEKMGPNNIYVQFWSEDAILDHHSEHQLVSDNKHIKQAAYIGAVDAKLGYKREKIDGEIKGVTEAYFDLLGYDMVAGRVIDVWDQHRNTCIVDSDIAHSLREAGAIGIIGSALTIGHHECQIVGIVKPDYQNWLLLHGPKTVYIHQETVNRLSLDYQLGQMIIGFEPGEMKLYEQQLKQWFLKKGMNHDYFITSPKLQLELAQKGQAMMTGLLTIIGSVALIVGGIGVMNIMMVSILERRREIGIRMAVGANRRQIMTMIITETIFLNGLSSIIGTFLGIGLTAVICLFSGWPFIWILSPMLFGLLTTLGVGMISAIYPALVAAKLEPMEAIQA